MESVEREAIASICLLAAFADGAKADAEREKVREILDGLGIEGSPRLVQDAVLGRTSVEAEAGKLASPAARTLAFEMAVCVCDADGATSPPEAEFLDRLRAALDLPEGEAAPVRRAAEELATLPIDGGPGATRAAGSSPAAADTAAAPGRGASAPAPSSAGATGAADEPSPADQMILNYAILTGGLELLPQSIANLAVIPLQMKMVYRIGQNHGFTLDRASVKDFLGVLGIGLTGQMLENVARKIFRGLGRMAGGKILGSMTSNAAGAAVTFASTYALGQVAEAYYAADRSLDAGALRDLLARETTRARALYESHRGEIEARAKTIDVRQITSLVQGA